MEKLKENLRQVTLQYESTWFIIFFLKLLDYKTRQSKLEDAISNRIGTINTIPVSEQRPCKPFNFINKILVSGMGVRSSYDQYSLADNRFATDDDKYRQKMSSGLEDLILERGKQLW